MNTTETTSNVQREQLGHGDWLQLDLPTYSDILSASSLVGKEWRVFCPDGSKATCSFQREGAVACCVLNGQSYCFDEATGSFASSENGSEYELFFFRMGVLVFRKGQEVLTMINTKRHNFTQRQEVESFIFDHFSKDRNSALAQNIFQNKGYSKEQWLLVFSLLSGIAAIYFISNYKDTWAFLSSLFE